MGLPRKKLLFDAPADIEADFYQWCFEQAELVRLKRFDELDLANVIEELETLGRSERNALIGSYRLILSHLLKWVAQPDLRTRSWEVTIQRERNNVELPERQSPSLAAQAGVLIEDAWRQARREAAKETGLAPTGFPAECPYTPAQLRDHDWMPS